MLSELSGARILATRTVLGNTETRAKISMPV